ncbi:MAG TPA: hypothetical protein VKJ01_09585 [Candidatus Solibacter sp.]|nr:hypothetical protein [Candidatus Solibacter sp.]
MWASVGHAQAWMSSADSGSVSLSYVDTWTTKHWLPNGGTLDVGHIRTFTYDLGAEYSPTDRLMFSASVPLIESEYHGAFPHPTEVDNGAYHATITDLRTEMHYQLLLEPIAIAPYVAYVLPLHNYETLGHAAPGRGLDETWVGVAFGKTLDKWIPRTYIEARFTYAFVQAVQHIFHDKENVDVDLGYFITPYLSVQGFWHWQQTLGGIDYLPAPTNYLFPYHDQLTADDFTAVGFSTAWRYSDHSSFSFSYSGDIAGRVGHKVDSAYAVSYAYDFGNR